MGYHTLFISLVTLTTLMSYINYRYIKIPKTIFLTVSSILISIAVTIMVKLMPHQFKDLYALLSGVNFRSTILDVMLGYLLFAGSLRIDAVNLKKELGHVAYLASLGVLLSTLISGTLLWMLTSFININLPYSDCLIFGALISPTDAIAVIAVFKTTTKVPPHIQARVTGESLFNDAAGILLLVALVKIFYPSYGNATSVFYMTIGFIQEIAGALLWGYIIGKVTTAILKRVSDNELTILITITASGLGYAIAQQLHVSAIITMVVAGLYVGGHSKSNEFSKVTTLALSNFWELADDILNGFMFVLIGLEMLTINFNIIVVLIGLASLVIIFIARYISIYVPDFVLVKIFKVKLRQLSSKKEGILMSWGGVRGGISIALAWSIFNISPALLSITYVVVVASILLQGSTLKYVTEKLFSNSHNNKKFS
ncbi:MAG: sodium:proton antiporter [Burkholderiales bacterium]|jgi:CPA1 family monovalent cation:H+ antiporter|nr:sodium:proton antiporter [Burkholderiales bacterium]MCE3269505.1 sodium:proton antiporter [Burkholderiales bacterium]